MLERIEHSNNIVELKLARPPVNALNPELLAALRVAIEAAPASGARALVLSGGPGVFSAGLDVPRLLTLDSAGLEAAWRAFFGVCEALAKSPILSVAAINGHSPAGGAVLSLFCDYRVMARGPFKIGLNEVQVGLFVPDNIQYALRRLVGPHRAERLMVAGAMIESEQALAIGMIDEVTDQEHVTVRAVAWLDDMLKLPAHALANTRAIARADLIEVMADPARMDIPKFLREWSREETQGVLQGLVARLKSKG